MLFIHSWLLTKLTSTSCRLLNNNVHNAYDKNSKQKQTMKNIHIQNIDAQDTDKFYILNMCLNTCMQVERAHNSFLDPKTRLKILLESREQSIQTHNFVCLDKLYTLCVLFCTSSLTCEWMSRSSCHRDLS